MKCKSKAQLKKIMQAALRSEFGFAPALENITLLESDGLGTYVLASVCGKKYSFSSYVCSDGSIWVGAGTIERC